MHLADVPSIIVVSRRHEIITAAACELIANGISSAEANEPSSDVIDFGLKSPSIVVQEAAAAAMAAVSRLTDCTAQITR